MKKLRVRLTLWFAASFLAVTALFMVFTYRHLDVQLRRKTFGHEYNFRPDWIVRGSYSEGEVKEVMAELVVASLIYSLPLVLVTLVLGYLIARKSLSPIDSLNSQLEGISSKTLKQRVNLQEADEQFRALTEHLNEMLARLEKSFAEMSEYAAKVAHELRTPLTILRLKLEQSSGRIEPDLAEDLQSELHRLAHVVEQSLLIAKAEQGRLLWNPEVFDLAALLTDLLNDFRLLADDNHRQLTQRIEANCWVEADMKYCKQIIHALLTNALVHGDGDIRVRLARHRERVRLVLLNPTQASPSASGKTLGLGLRVVRAILATQPVISFRQRPGKAAHVSQLSFPESSLGSRPPAHEIRRPAWEPHRRFGDGI